MSTLSIGSDSVLLDLKILNGELSLKFDKYVNSYTVNVKNNVDTLEIEYKIRDTDEIKIVNNEKLNYGLNYVFLEISNGEEKNVYTLEVYKEKIENVMKYEEVTISSNNKERNEYMPYIISFTCFFIIMFFFIVIFHRKKSK